ncbi:hypothetical protein B0W48_01740 [Pseudoalteromonas aliena]|uniref:DUF3592 domain-containing protein n=1 Tax=Pseudoalteromonas aliena TaxID=247523 RepID=A0A1Q2GU28_9GAMM|nr:DUF3592 domain-containing protein [Pseudoalteromonas aliena]AQP98631.1 hypothetical protein B0W48_01740 [Pseudoalteromonas aliena]
MKILFMILGLLCSTISAFVIKEDYIFYKLSVETTGEVIDFNVSEDREGDDMYNPIIGFISNQGDSITFKTNSASSPPAYYVGENVAVRYNLTNPRDARLSGFFSMWGTSIFFIFLSAFLIFLGFKYKTV